jgi:hypothetical protein
LRSLKRHAARRQETASVRVVGIDDWSWRKGTTYGTILSSLRQLDQRIGVRFATAIDS